MPEEKICAYESEWPGLAARQKCSRPVWEGGGPEEKFCLFHSEQYEKKKEAFRREIDLFKEDNPSEYLLGDKKDEIEIYDFVGFKFPDGCSDFNKTNFEKPIDFSSATFSGEAHFEGATFRGFAGFNRATFRGEARFKGATFRGFAGFNSATFNGEAWFDEATFSGKALFDRATFSGYAEFTRATFSYNAAFHKTTFSGNAAFHNATFSGKAAFREATFSGGAWFYRATFSGNAGFQYINSNKTLYSFEEVLIKKNILIRTRSKTGCLLASLSFNGAKIIGNLTIEDSEIEKITADDLVYRSVLSLRNVVIRNNDIEQPSSFENVYLERAKFINLDLSTVALGGPFIREVIFDRISFGKPTTPGWKCSSLLLGRPNEATYEERYARYCDEGIKKDKFCAAETVYRTLKHEMEKQHAKGLARRMRAGELECKLHGDANLFQKAFLFGYRFLSGFGLRWFRALVFWLICIFSFAWWGYNNQPAVSGTYQEATSISAGNSSGSTNVVSREEKLNFNDALLHSFQITSVVMRPSKTITNPDIGWVEFAEKIISPFLLMLFLQAARNATRD